MDFTGVVLYVTMLGKKGGCVYMTKMRMITMIWAEMAVLGLVLASLMLGCKGDREPGRTKSFHELNATERGAVQELLRNVYVCQYQCPKTGKDLSTLSIISQHGDWSPELKQAVSELLPKAHVEWEKEGRTHTISVTLAEVRNFPGDSITIYPEKVKIVAGGGE